ncbi:hypothetical protein DFH09DRAFT_937130 [Mycena vulgaris]|nr:hypothetical protein DFH09DRAFT_937130 [Mycena vulgaris]
MKADSPEGDLTLKRWAHLRLPNGQIARSGWKEKHKPLKNVRMARNVKASNSISPLEIAEVEFYFCTKDGHALALASLYSRPEEELLRDSYKTVWSCQRTGKLTVINVRYIKSVVAMVPHKYNGQHAFFLVEKPGLDIISLSGYQEEDDAVLEGS